MPPPKRRDRDSINSNGSCTGSVIGTASGGSTVPPPPPPPPPSLTATNAASGANIIVEPKDQELFLQAFEKPTQIYRFLRQRHDSNPIFLNRTLSYMKERMSRTNKKRANFKVDSLLETITQKSKCINNNFLSIIYTALYDKNESEFCCWKPGDKVTVESILFKITKSKRKDSTADFQEVLRHTSVVTYCPQVDEGRYSTISIPVQNVCPFGDQHTVYKLLFRINFESVLNSVSDGSNKRSKFNTKAYGCELLILERNIGCVAEGDYEAALQEINAIGLKSFSPKKRSWEALPKNYFPQKTKFDTFNYIPTLKFRLVWTSTEIPTVIDAKNINSFGRRGELVEHTLSNGMTIEPYTGNNVVDHITNVNHNNNCIKNYNENGVRNPVRGEKIQIIYNFLYNNNTRQQTEYTQEVICPWCSLGCLRLYSLLKHLKLCHARFNFTYQPTSEGARIDVTINDSYDGSYSGSPHDLVGPSGCSFARTCGPVRRTSVTNLLVCRPRRQKTCLDEFMELDEDDLNNQRCYITGHNRLYHHTETCLPVHPKELDTDSEGESDPLWLRQKTIQMIDEFSDVNEGEKELMKLWNLHVMKYGYVGDCQIPLACEMFLNSNGRTIISKNLYRNFILHLCSLFDYGLCSAETVYKTVQMLQGILSKFPEGQEMMSEQRAKQLQYWLKVGIHKQDEQKLKSPQKSNTNGNSHTNHQETNSKTTANNMETKSMHPPTKRIATTMKQRMSGMPQKGLNASSTNKMMMAHGPNKIAKKSVNQVDEVGGVTSSRDKQRDNDNKSDREKSKLLRNSSDARLNAVKRKLSMRDNLPSQPAPKRTRCDINNAVNNNINNNHHINNNTRHGQHYGATISTYNGSISIAAATRSAHHRDDAVKNSILNSHCSTSAASAITLPKRLITRRQSLTGYSANASNNETTTGKSATSGTDRNTINTHSLRKRTTLPAARADKR